MFDHKIFKSIFLSFLLIFKFTFTLEKKKLTTNHEFKLGLENIPNDLLKNLKVKKEKNKIGLITNQTGIDQLGNRNVDILLSKGLNIKAIFVPEHGFTGTQKAEKKINDDIDEKTKIPIISLYGGDSKFKKFDKKDLENIDIFIFDMQDSGIRHYTYISTLFKIMEIASEHSKKVIVLDRPNPLGIPMEGPLVDKKFISFISIASIPLRHSLTIGELAKYFNKFEFKNKINLIVIPMKNYERTRGLNGVLPIFLSPNITDIISCLNYSFLGILGEIYPLSVLVGTEHAFKCLMIPDSIKFPKKKLYELKRILSKQNVSSSIFKYYKKENNQNYTGLKISIPDINKFSNMNTIITILKFLKNNGIKLSYSKAFSKVMGTDQFKNYIENKIFKKKLLNKINNDLKTFLDKIEDLLIYSPIPKIEKLRN